MNQLSPMTGAMSIKNLLNIINYEYLYKQIHNV